MKRLRLILAEVLALISLLSAGLAAGAPIPFKGRVIDENGIPVSNAQVKLQLGTGQIFEAATDDSGYFSFPNLAPGEYIARIEKTGFFLLENQKIELTAENTEFAFTLNHVEEVREKVDVTIPENRIDTTTTTSTVDLTAKQIIDIPVPSSHNLLQSLIAMPQVILDSSNQLHFAGANNTEVQYLLDGVEVGDPASNGLTSRMIVDAVRTAEVQTGRFGAEYAHPGGAILNYVTREGDDRWRFNTTDFIPAISFQQGT